MEFKHLIDNNISYVSHLKRTVHISCRMIYGGIVVLIHGVYPSLFETTASNIIKELNEELNSNNKKEN